MKDSGKTAAELDSARRSNMAYEYLCHLEEAKKFVFLINFFHLLFPCLGAAPNLKRTTNMISHMV